MEIGVRISLPSRLVKLERSCGAQTRQTDSFASDRETEAHRQGRASSLVRERVVAEPVAADEPELEIDSDAEAAADNDAPIEVSEFRPVASTDDENTTRRAVDVDKDADDDSKSGALVATDPLGRYLTEIRRFPLLSREEEAVIARRYVRDKDPEDAYRLVTANLRLVVKLAYEFARATKNVLDLIQEGNVGLMEAVKNFDPEHGIRFPSYAVWWVRAYIYRYLINNWRLVKIGTTQAQRKLFFNLRKETERLEREGFKPQPLLLAHRMGVRESEVREMQERMGQSEVSLDQPTGTGEDNERGCSTLSRTSATIRRPKRRTASGESSRARRSSSSRRRSRARSWRYSRRGCWRRIPRLCRKSARASESAASACVRSRRGSSGG